MLRDEGEGESSGWKIARGAKLFICAVLLSVLGFVSLDARKATEPSRFFPFSQGTYWMYKGTVRWYDYENDKPASAEVTWKMSVEKVIERQGVVAAVVKGFPGDLDWTAGTTEPKPWLILEDARHKVYYENLGPDFDLAKLNGDEHVFDKFMVEDNFFFQWPLSQGAKYCDEEAKKREDGLYCWVVEESNTKKSITVKGAPTGDKTAFQLKYRTLPDDTTMELVPGLGLLSYEYHHHGTVADTELQLVEFHPAPESPEGQSPKP
jgi:hypothetical protein